MTSEPWVREGGWLRHTTVAIDVMLVHEGREILVVLNEPDGIPSPMSGRRKVTRESTGAHVAYVPLPPWDRFSDRRDVTAAPRVGEQTRQYLDYEP